jgi:polyhydroxyalkanoate synthesis regulator phasin
MNEQRKDILDLLAEGKVTADEAERLIAALERDEPPVDARPKGRAKYLRVLVESSDSARINVRVPLQLLRAGVQLAALVPAPALERANAELSKSGVPIDLTQLKPQQLEALVEHLDELTVEVDDLESRVRVFCE